jgi:hypothetical protein
MRRKPETYVEELNVGEGGEKYRYSNKMASICYGCHFGRLVYFH